MLFFLTLLVYTVPHIMVFGAVIIGMDKRISHTQSETANKSLITNIKQEIPQGSMLGLLLYFIYANDLQRMITKCHADDMVLYSMSGNFVAAKQT